MELLGLRKIPWRRRVDEWHKSRRWHRSRPAIDGRANATTTVHVTSRIMTMTMMMGEEVPGGGFRLSRGPLPSSLLHRL